MSVFSCPPFFSCPPPFLQVLIVPWATHIFYHLIYSYIILCDYLKFRNHKRDKLWYLSFWDYLNSLNSIASIHIYFSANGIPSFFCFKDLLTFILCTWMFRLPVCLCTMYVQYPLRLAERQWISCCWSYRWLWAIRWGLGIKSVSSARSYLLSHLSGPILFFMGENNSFVPMYTTVSCQFLAVGRLGWFYTLALGNSVAVSIALQAPLITDLGWNDWSVSNWLKLQKWLPGLLGHTAREQRSNFLSSLWVLEILALATHFSLSGFLWRPFVKKNMFLK